MRHAIQEKGAVQPDPRRNTIIAVGGAKGGIGKSLLAANLSVYLASRGWRTAAVDMDLGAANLHLYLGAWALKHRLNDYLDKKISDIEEIAVDTRHGPRLFGGGGSRLGSANLPFARKLKLMRAIRGIDADFVILDLGGDTAYNILDFYLLADYGLVVTSCDPASYLDTYSFIKMALHRRLMRIFGPESAHRGRKDATLLALIKGHIGPENMPDGDRAAKIEDLLMKVASDCSHGYHLVQEIVDRFQPFLIVNMAEDPTEVDDLVKRFQNVARRMLSIEVPCLGSIPFDRQIARSTHDLKPDVIVHPHGRLARSLEWMLDRLKRLDSC